MLRVLDVCTATFAYVFVVDVYWWGGYLNTQDVMEYASIIPVVVIINVVALFGRAHPGLHGAGLPQYFVGATVYALLVSGAILFLAYLLRLEWVSRLMIATYGAATLAAIVAGRMFLGWWYLHGRKERRENFIKVLVIGTGNRARHFMQQYHDRSDWGIDIIGMLDPEPESVCGNVDGIPVLGGIDTIQQVLAEQVVDEVVICLPRRLINDIGGIVDACQEQGVCLKYMADFYDMGIARVRLDELGRLPILTFEPVSHDEVALFMKRIIDIVVTTLAMPFVLPFFAIVAIAIKLDSKGPVFFLQERVGLNKRLFRMVKFRSMHVDAEQRMGEIEHLNEAAGPIFKIKNDPRVTKVGRFIRRTSIDELPQLLNVFLGQMSLVGPRPMSRRDVALFDRGIQRRRFCVRPGLACLREISGRSDLTFEQWLELDLKYIQEWSLMLDLKIVLKVIPVVLKGSGAS